MFLYLYIVVISFVSKAPHFRQFREKRINPQKLLLPWLLISWLDHKSSIWNNSFDHNRC